MADDTITVNMMPSCGNCKKQSDYEGYKKYTKTWKNLCTSTTCKSKTPGTLQDNPKGVYEGELTCSKCDSDYCLKGDSELFLYYKDLNTYRKTSIKELYEHYDEHEYYINSFNIKKREFEWQLITRVFKNPIRQLYKFKFANGDILVTTINHNFYDKNFLKKPISFFDVNDEVLCYKDSYELSETCLVDYEIDSKETTYNITVNNNHNYFVGKILIANCGFCGTEKRGSARFKLIAADDSSDSNDTEDSGSSSYNDMILDLIAPLDGNVEYRVIENKVFVNKIPDPSTASVWIKEGINVVNEGITVHDYNPNTYNKFIIHYGNNSEIILTDDKLIERFGEKVKELTATKKLTTYEKEETNDSSSTSEDSKSEDSTTDDDSNDESIDDSKLVAKTTDVPINNYEEALEFGKTEMAKSKRDNGHGLECKIIGNNQVKQGMWAYVYLPSFNIDMNMYITKTSQSSSATDEWLVGVTLQDYPPSLSSGESNTAEDSSSEDTSDESLDSDDESGNDEEDSK